MSRKEPPGSRKSHFLTFAERITRLEINPIHRNDFLGEIKTYTEGSDTRNDIECSLVVLGDKIEVLQRGKLSTDVTDEVSLKSQIYEKLNSTYFESALKYWKGRNLTRDFSDCSHKLFSLCRSLPQILFNLASIIEILMDQIENPHSLAKEPCYHLLAILSRDVGEEIASYLPSLLNRLIAVVDAKSPKSIEYTFYSLATLFRFLFRVILRDLRKYLHLYSPWLLHKSHHIRLFAAESLSFLLRKQSPSQLSDTLRLLFEMLDRELVLNNSGMSEPESSTKQLESQKRLLAHSAQEKTGGIAFDHEDPATFFDACSDAQISSCSDSDDEEIRQQSEDLDHHYYLSGEARDRLAESVGLLFFEVVKNVQNSFTGKLSIVLEFLFDQINATRTLSPKSIEVRLIVVKVFFQSLRNHTAGYDTAPCQDIEQSLVTFLKSQTCEVIRALSELTTTGGSKLKFNEIAAESEFNMTSDFQPALFPYMCSLKLIAEWVCLRPRPNGLPSNIIAESVVFFCETLSALECQLSNNMIEKNGGQCYFLIVWKVLLQILIKLWISDPVIMGQLAFSQKTGALISTVIHKLEVSSNCSLKVLLSSLHLMKALLLHDDVEGVQAFLLKVLVCVLQKSVQLLPDHHQSSMKVKANAAHLFAKFVSRLDLIHGSTDVTMDAAALVSSLTFDIQSVLKLQNTNLLEIQKSMKDLHPLPNDDVPVLFAFFHAIVSLLKVQLPTSSNNNNKEFIIFPKCFSEVLILADAVLSSLSSSISEDLDLFSLSIASPSSPIIDLVKSISARLRLMGEVVAFLCHHDVVKESAFPSTHVADVLSKMTGDDLSTTNGGGCPFLAVWHRLLSVCQPSNEKLLALSEEAGHAIALECKTWISIYIEILNQIMTNGDVMQWTSDERNVNLWLNCCAASLRHPNAETRRHVVHLIQRLPAVEYQTLLLRQIEYDSAKHCFITNAMKKDLNGNAKDLLDSLFDAVLQLDSLPNTLENERSKNRLVSQIASRVITMASMYGITWCTVLATRVLLSQFSEKFMLLWAPTLQSVSDITNALSAQAAAQRPTQDDVFSQPISCVETDTSHDTGKGLRKRKLNEIPAEIGTVTLADKKKRRLQSFILSSYHLWLFEELQFEIYFSCQQNRRSDATEVPQRRVIKVKRKRNAVQSRFAGLRLSTQPAEYVEYASTDYKEFWISAKFDYKETFKREIIGGTNMQTDPLTRHRHYMEIFSQLALLCSGFIGELMFCNQSGISHDIQIMGKWVEWLMQWALACSLSVCEAEAQESDDVNETCLSQMKSLLIREKQQRRCRLVDVLKTILNLGHIGKSGDVSSKVGASKAALAWTKLLDNCLCRILTYPDSQLQTLILQIALHSHLSFQLSSYKTQLENVISDGGGISDHLLFFSVDAKDGLINQDHRRVVIPIVIRILFSKLSKKAMIGTGSKTPLLVRRKVTFRYFAALPPQEVPILLAVLFRPVISIRLASNGEYISSEKEKEEILVLFLRWASEHSLNEDQGLFNKNCWSIDVVSNNVSDDGGLELLIGQWKFNNEYCLEIPLMKLCQRPLCLTGLLTSLEEVITQMRLSVTPLMLYLGQFLVTVISQFWRSLQFRHQIQDQIKSNADDQLQIDSNHHVSSHPPTSSLIGYARLRKIVKDSILMFGKIISYLPELSPLWNRCLKSSHSVFLDILKVSLSGGGLSAIVKFICQLSHDSHLFEILKGSLAHSIPMLFDSLKSSTVLASISLDQRLHSTKKGEFIDAVLTFVLRLCRGGHLDKMQAVVRDMRDRHTGIMTMSLSRKERRMRNKRRQESDSEADQSDVEMSQSVSQSANLLCQLKAEVEQDCATGRELLIPYLKTFLENLEILVSHRRSQSLSVNALHTEDAQNLLYTRGKRRMQRFGQQSCTLMIKELEVLTEISQFAHSCPITACKLIQLLIVNLNTMNRKMLMTEKGVTRFHLILSSIRELLVHVVNRENNSKQSDGSSADVLLSLESVILKQLQTLQDLRARQELTSLLLCVNLVKLGCPTPSSVVSQILSDMPHALASGVGTGSAIERWLPCTLATNHAWSRSIKAEEHDLWSVSVAMILLGLTTLRPRVAAIEPDFDLHMLILMEIQEYCLDANKLKKRNNNKVESKETILSSLKPEQLVIPAQYQPFILLQCLFIMRTSGVDLAVCRMAVRLICCCVERIGRAAYLRQQLYTKGILGASRDRSDQSKAETMSFAKVEAEWAECSILFKGLLHSVMTTVRRCLQSPDPQTNRSAIEVLSQMVRTFGPFAEFLPSPTNPSSFFDLPKENVRFDLDQGLIRNRFHLDLFSLIKYYGESEKDAIVGSEVGGDIFLELLHLQKHRRARGIQILTKGLERGAIERATAIHVCIPLATKGVLQTDSKETLNTSLLNHSIECLAFAARVAKWSDCLSLVKKLADTLHRTPNREALLIKAMCRILSAFDYQIEDATNEFMSAASTPTTSASTPVVHAPTTLSKMIEESVVADSAAEKKREAEMRKKRKSIAKTDLPESVEQQSETAQMGNQSDDESEISSDDDFEDVGNQQSSEINDQEIQMCKARDRIIMIQQSIKFQLLPLLRRLMTVKALKNQNKTAAVLVERNTGKGKAQDDTVLLIRPQIVSLVLQVTRYLPSKQFHAELPRLVHTLATCLASRETDCRRKARAAIITLVTALGPTYFPWLINTISNSLTSGYQVSVLLFTSTAALCHLVLGHPSIGSPNKKPVQIPCGSIDDVVDYLLPLVTQELNRLCDPDRPEYEQGSIGVLTKRAGIDEQRYFRSGDLIHLLCRVSSFEVLSQKIMRYLYGLLTGTSCQDRSGSSRASVAFSKKYGNIVQSLFVQAVIGVAGNPSFSTFIKLRLAFRLLRLHEILLPPITAKQNLTTLPMKKRKEPQSVEVARSKQGLTGSELHDEEDRFFVSFLANENDEEAIDNMYSAQSAQTIGQSEERLKKFLIQPGAATGRSAEQVLRVTRGIDQSVRATTLAVAGLRLLLAVQPELRAHPLTCQLVKRGGAFQCREDLINPIERVTTEIMVDLMNASSEYVVDCFCGPNDELFELAATCLMKLLAFDLTPVHEDGQRIAATILRIYQNSGGSSSKAVADKVKGITASCTRVLAILLSHPSSGKWFGKWMSKGDVAAAGQSLKQRDTRNIDKKNRLPNTTFKTALLSQIRSALDDHRLQISALQLFKKVILLNQKTENLQVAEHAALIYQCVDEIGTLMLHQGSRDKVVGLCSSIYVDFIMEYPMSEKVQQQRIAFLIRNLSFTSFEGRRAMLTVIHQLAGRLPPEILRERYAAIFLLGLILRLGKEPDKKTRQMTRAVLHRVFALIDSEDARLRILRIVKKGFLTPDLIQRASLVEFLEIVVTYYGEVQTHNKLDIILPTLEACISMSQQVRTTSIVPQVNEGLPAVPIVPLSDWKITYLSLRNLEHIIANMSGINLLNLIIQKGSLASTFLMLWRFSNIEGLKSTHTWIKLTAMRVLGQSLIKLGSKEIRKKETFVDIVQFFYSRGTMPELGNLAAKISKTTKQQMVAVTPLAYVLHSLIQWSCEIDIENNPFILQTLVPVVGLIAKALLTNRVLSDECFETKNEIINSVDVKTDSCSASDDEENADDVDVSNDAIGDTQKMSSQSNCEWIRMTTEAVVTLHDPESNKKGDDDASCLYFDIVDDPNEVDVKDEKKTDSECEVPEDHDIVESNDENEENEELLFDLETVAAAAAAASVSLEQDYNLVTDPEKAVDKVFTCPVDQGVPEIISDSDCDLLISRTRLRWLIGRLSWSLRRGLGDVSTNAVRLCAAMRILTELITILPSPLLKSDYKTNNVLQSILNSIYRCANLTPHLMMMESDTKSTQIDETNFELGVFESKLPLNFPKKLNSVVSAFATHCLTKIEDGMKLKGLESDYYEILKVVRMSIVKKKKARKVESQLLKVKQPQLAAMKKIKKHARDKKCKKKQLQRKRERHAGFILA